VLIAFLLGSELDSASVIADDSYENQKVFN
jgi:hypothetical protein